MGEETGADKISLIVIKVTSMVSFFLMILIVGSLPLRLKAFKENKVIILENIFFKTLLSLTAAFSGGLFISVGMIHLLPEAVENFELVLPEKGAFPFAYLATVLSFTLILFIEKIATSGGGHEHHKKPSLQNMDHYRVQDTTHFADTYQDEVREDEAEIMKENVNT